MSPRPAIAALLAAIASPAAAETIFCVPGDTVSWSGGEANYSPRSGDDPMRVDFTLDLDTGAYSQDYTDGIDPLQASYAVLQHDENNWVGWNEPKRALIRVRLTDSEMQFVHDYRRQLDIGTCSILPDGATP